MVCGAKVSVLICTFLLAWLGFRGRARMLSTNVQVLRTWPGLVRTFPQERFSRLRRCVRLRGWLACDSAVLGAIVDKHGGASCDAVESGWPHRFR